MRRFQIVWLGATLLSAMTAVVLAQSTTAPATQPAKPTAPPAPEGMEQLFNGRDLTGWDGDPRLWSVKDGALRGETTREKSARSNTFLIWKGGVVKDFELRLSYRTNSSNNSGIQYRSKQVPPRESDANKWVVGGYQAEVRNNGVENGFIYDERGSRGRMCYVGEKVVWDPEKGKQIVGMVNDPKAIAPTFHIDGWNDYVIIAKGNNMRHYINGVQYTDFTDNDPKLAATEGIVALQLHTGEPMWVEFKEIRIKHLK